MTTTTDDGPGSSGAVPPPPPPAPAGPPPRRLTRSRQGRLVAGVCAGLGRATDVDPVVYRVTLAVLTLFGGSGVVLYALAWLLLPEDDGAPAPVEALTRGAGTAAGGLPASVAAVGAGVVVLVLLEGGSTVGHVEGFPLAVLAGLGVWLLLRRRGAEPAGATAYPPGAAADGAQRPGSSAAGGGSASSWTVGAEPGPGPAAAAAGYGPPPPYDPGAPAWEPLPPPPAYLAPVETPRRSVLGRLTLSALLVVLGVAALLDAAGTVDLTATGGLALALVVVGAGLVVGAWWGRSRGLVVLGALLSVALLVGASADVPHGGTGTRSWAPVTVDEVREPFRLGGGEAVLDLTGLAVERGTVRVEVRVGAGQLQVLLPDDVTVEVDAQVGVGAMEVLGVTREGLGNELSERATVAGSGSRRVVLDAELGIGELEVVRGQA